MIKSSLIMTNERADARNRDRMKKSNFRRSTFGEREKEGTRDGIPVMNSAIASIAASAKGIVKSALLFCPRRGPFFN